MKLVPAAGLLLMIVLSMGATEKAPLSEYRSRREKLAAQLQGQVVVLFSRPDKDLVRFFQEPNFYYLTGFDQPGAILMIDAAEQPAHEYFFLPARNADQERWTGAKLAPGPAAEKVVGIQDIEDVKHFPELLKKVSAGRTIATLPESFNVVRNDLPRARLNDASGAIAALRQVKSASEIALLEKAAQITVKGQAAAAKAIAPGVMEYEVQAALEYEFRRNGSERPGFPSIVGSGPFSTVLHYDRNDRRMEAGDLVVIDSGAEYSGYSADVTRTYPVSGKFTARQREIYQIVLDAQTAAIAAIQPGATLYSVHQVAYNYIKSKGYAQYFIHGTSHHIGLEVHDVGDLNRPLEPNMVITAEPGIYLPAEQLGVRIEDDVLVTPTGARVLSNFPKEASEIEALVQKRSQNAKMAVSKR